MLFFPFPHFLEKFFASEILTMLDLAGFLQSAKHDRFRRDPGVIGAGQPKDFLAIHARLASQNVLDGIVEHVAQRECAGDVGWRNNNRVSGPLLADARGIGDKALLVGPKLIPFVLDRLRFVGFGNFRHATIQEMISISPKCRKWSSSTYFLVSAYSMLSISACKLASTIFSLTPTVPHSSLPLLDSIRTRVLAAVPVVESRMR